jgi:hypothetical protein
MEMEIKIARQFFRVIDFLRSHENPFRGCRIFIFANRGTEDPKAPVNNYSLL